MASLSIVEFADRISQIMPLIMKEFARRQLKGLYKDKVTLPQFLILEFLHKEGQSRMSFLAHFMNVTTAAMTGIVDRLVRDGYVKRVYDPKDRRIVEIELTGRGSELVRKIHQERRKMIMRIFVKISEADRRDYLRILMQIKEILSQEGKEANK